MLKKNTINGVYNQVISEGDFSNLIVGNNTVLLTEISSKDTCYYRFVVYIDGTMDNSNDMMNGSLKSFLKLSSYEKNMYLSDVQAGSYVAYTGNNGCSGEACNGQNANYVSDTDMGYCNSSYKFTVNGWRVGYISDGTAYLVSAGAPTCLCTNSDGTVDTSGSYCSSYEETNGAPLHIANLNSEALKYCNSNYAYGGVCNSSSAWSMQNDDYNQITGSTLSSCDGNSSTACGLNNTLIDNGGVYWYATPWNSASSYRMFTWDPNSRYVAANTSFTSRGVRPVLRLNSLVYIIGGSGTYEEPYLISNSNVKFDANGGYEWTDSTCTSSVNLNGTTCSKRVPYGTSYGNLPVPVRTGYTFTGWYTDPISGTEITEPTIVNVSGYHTIYAHWTTDSIASVILSSGPDKNKYLLSESVDYTGIKLKVTYSSFGYKIIDGTSYVTGYTTNTDNSSNIRYVITIKYSAFTVTVTTYKDGWYGAENGHWYCYENTEQLKDREFELPNSNTSTTYSTFYFNSNGTVFTGWKNVGQHPTNYTGVTSYSYYLESPYNVIGVTEYVSESNWTTLKNAGYVRGSQIKNSWAYIYNGTRYWWYYFDGNIALADQTKTINGSSYTFDSNGHCISGNGCG